MRWVSRFLVVYICYFILFTALPIRIYAQSNVWDGPAKSSKKSVKKLDNGKKKLKKWKEHVQQWGLNDNYTHQLALSGKLNSNGWSGSVYYFHTTDPGVQAVWQLSFSEIRHDKQVKQQKPNVAFPELGIAAPFIFGKINNLYTVQLSYGREQLLLPGVVDGNLSVSFRYSVGVCLAMLKPYYLKLLDIDYSQTNPVAHLKEEKYTDSTAAMFLEEKNILGASKWNKGLNETRLVPGLSLETAFVMLPGSHKAFIETITLGANASIYSKPLPVMAELKASSFQACLFVGLAIGKKWK